MHYVLGDQLLEMDDVQNSSKLTALNKGVDNDGCYAFCQMNEIARVHEGELHKVTIGLKLLRTITRDDEHNL